MWLHFEYLQLLLCNHGARLEFIDKHIEAQQNGEPACIGAEPHYA